MNNPFTMISRAFRYIFAPFYPSEWKKAGSEVKDTLSTPQKIKSAGIKMGAYYLLFSPLVAMPFYNTCLFHPYVAGDFALPCISGVTKQDVFFYNTRNERLHGWYFEQAGAGKTVLVSHGNAGNLSHRVDLIKMLLKTGASVFIYDYAGYGLSKGSPSVDGCIDDSVAAFDFLTKEKKLPAESIVLYGESIGTAFTCQLAERRKSGALILQSSFQSLPQIAGEKMPLFCVYPKNIFPCNQLDSLSYVKGEHPPLLIIHGKLDNLLPCHNGEDLYKAASAEKQLVILPEAGHNDVPFKLTDECKLALAKFCGKQE